MTQNAPTRLPGTKGSRRKLAALFVSFALAWGLASSADAALVNTATVTGDYNGQPVTAADTVSVDLIDAAPGLTVVECRCGACSGRPDRCRHAGQAGFRARECPLRERRGLARRNRHVPGRP